MPGGGHLLNDELAGHDIYGGRRTEAVTAVPAESHNNGLH